MRVAIIFYGLTRNLKKTYMSIRKNILEDLQRRNIEYKIYLHTYSLKMINNMRSGERNIMLDNHEWKMLKPHKYMIEDQDEVDTKLRLEEFCRFKNPWPEDFTKNSMKNVLRQLNSLKKAWTLLEHDPEYDAYFILRPDLFYVNPIMSEDDISLPIKDMTYYIPQWGKTRNGENDRLCVTSRIGAFVYMNRIEHIFQYAQTDAPNSHRFLKSILDKCHAKRYPLHIKAIRVRADPDPLRMDTMENFVVSIVYKRTIARYKDKDIALVKNSKNPYEIDDQDI